MKYLDVYDFIKTRLTPVPPLSPGKAEPGEEPQLEVTPIVCTSFDELCNHYFGRGGIPPDNRLEYALEIEYTLATMCCVILSTSTTGAQLALRVIGPPGGAKSTLAESLSCCRQLVYPRSKFTGIVSGWSSLRKSQNTAAKMHGLCVLIKDADPMLKLQNLPQVMSEIRDVLGDNVIRAEYRTGRDFDIHTLFTVIFCGTEVLREIDDALLGARFLDICIHKHGAPTEKIVRRAIKSQFNTITKQLSGGVKNSIINEVVRKEIIMNLAPPSVGFLLHKRQQLQEGIEVRELTQAQEDRIYAMGELIAYLRMRPSRTRDGDVKYRSEKEIATRLGEHFMRLLIFLGIVFQDSPVTIGDREFQVAQQIMLDTLFGFNFEIVQALHRNKHCSVLDLMGELGTSHTRAQELVQDLRETKVIAVDKSVSNPHGHRGNKINVYTLSPDLQFLCNKVGL